MESSVSSHRFLNNNFLELQQINRSPIYGYQDLPVMTLEQAVENILSVIPSLPDYVASAKQNCNRTSTLLTWDESAAIYLYSMQTDFFATLNRTLRDEKRHLLKPWFAYLKLLLTALRKLPSFNDTVWRGVTGDIDSSFANNGVQTWWSVNSCSKAVNVVEAFLGVKGVLFAIKVAHGKDISDYSAIRDEQEVLIMSGTRLRMKNMPLTFNNNLLIIQLEEELEANLNIQRYVHQENSIQLNRLTHGRNPFPRMVILTACIKSIWLMHAGYFYEFLFIKIALCIFLDKFYFTGHHCHSFI